MRHQTVQVSDFQPLAEATYRLLETLEYIGSPVDAHDRDDLQSYLKKLSGPSLADSLQKVLDSYCLFDLEINPEGRVHVRAGAAGKTLIQNGWKTYLIKVHNQAGTTSALRVQSPQSRPLHVQSGVGFRNSHTPTHDITDHDIPFRFLEVQLFKGSKMSEFLSGLNLEYKVIQLYTRDSGLKDATFGFDVGQGTQDLGFRSEVSILFNCARAVNVHLTIVDDNGKPTMASILIQDKNGHIYPLPSRRLAPDFFFQEHIYRSDGESVQLPPGQYTFTYSRGPEYLEQHKEVIVPDDNHFTVSLSLKRWIDLASQNWFSGDVHIHASGCSHYENPSEGVMPNDIIRNIIGEDIHVGSVLTWGPSWHFQKQFFEGMPSRLSTRENIMRYDIEASGFPSSHAGHLSLLGLQEDDYPGTTCVEEWPSWNLPVLQWARKQGAVTGFTHSGLGVGIGQTLPNYDIPSFSSIGANEYLIDVTHNAIDLLAAVNTMPVNELNLWYHSLNCGFRTRLSGETDFPCILDTRVGIGRSYVGLNPKNFSFEGWLEGLKRGRSYVSDGSSHIIDFSVNQLNIGEQAGDQKPFSELSLTRPSTVHIYAAVAALLPEIPGTIGGYRDLDNFSRMLLTRNTGDKIQSLPLDEKPYWSLEKARISETRNVLVEVIVNGRPVSSRRIIANGQINPLEFDLKIEASSWVALRIFPSSHTNPIFIIVDGKPIRASRKSAQWCIDATQSSWEAIRGAIRESERSTAQQAFEYATKTYMGILAECKSD